MNQYNIRYTKSGLICLTEKQVMDFFKEKILQKNTSKFNEELIQETKKDRKFMGFLDIFKRCLKKEDARDIAYGAVIMKKFLKTCHESYGLNLPDINEADLAYFIKDFSEIEKDSIGYSRDFKNRIESEEPMIELYNILLAGDLILNQGAGKDSCLFAQTGSFFGYEVYRRRAETNQLEKAILK